jgi:hypothetical protein
MSNENVELIRRAYEAYSRGNVPEPTSVVRVGGHSSASGQWELRLSNSADHPWEVRVSAA